jgi:tetratricopeptide (TPR) repeat protein
MFPSMFAAALLFVASVSGHTQSAPPKPPAAQPPATQAGDPPEEDAAFAPKTYVLNPMESDRNIRVGDFYWHKNDFRAALGRYRDATRYNPSSPEAFFKVGEAEQKLKHKDEAKVAFQKVIQLAPDSKLAGEAKKKIPKS